MTGVYVVAAKRTAIGSFGGALKNFAPHQLATSVMKAALEQAQIAGTDVQHVVM